MTRGILNIAVGERYLRGQDRLVASLDQLGIRTDRLFWREEWPGKPHSVAPYGFKIDAFRYAAEAGYEKAFWLDSTAWAVKPFDLVWDYLDHQPALVLADGWNIGQWTNDQALKIYGIERDYAMGLQMCLAGVLGLNLQHPKGQVFLDYWSEIRAKGGFLGDWTNERSQSSEDPRCMGHRHDQSAASWLCYRLGIPMAHLQTFVRYENQEAPEALIRVTGI